MYDMTILSWIVIGFGLITCIPLLVAQLVIIFNPEGQQAKDILIGKGEDWRDKTHFKSAYSLALTDWIVFAPCFVTGIIGLILETYWGYILLTVSGAIQLYINVFLLFFEREYVYPVNGPLKYYTYLWGNFIYWSLAAIIYGIIRLSGLVI